MGHEQPPGIAEARPGGSFMPGDDGRQADAALSERVVTTGSRPSLGADDWLSLLRDPAREASALLELGDIVRRGLAKILRLVPHLQDHDLDDFTQETLLRVVQGLDAFRKDSRFTTWALAIGTRVAFTELRRRRVRREAPTAFDQVREDVRMPGAAPAPRPDSRMARDDLLDRLRGCIESELTERQRLAVLAELRGIPSVEIARQLGTNRNALYKLHHDARRKLRAALMKAGYTSFDVRRQIAEENVS